MTSLVSWLVLAVTILGWIIPFAMILVVPVNRKPSEATAWLMLLFALPWIGLVAFWLVGSPKLSLRRRTLQREINHSITSFVEHSAADPALAPIIAPPIAERYQPFVALNTNLGALPAMVGNAVEIITDYDGMLARMAADIDTAQRFVHVEFYILIADEATEGFFRAMEQAVGRGVTVRVLYDPVGSRKYPTYQATLARMRAAAIEAHPMLPLRRAPDRNRPDLRNHRKIVVVDGEIGYTGSLNMIVRTYHRSDSIAYDELMARVRGPAADALDAVFRTDWYSETGERLVPDGNNRYKVEFNVYGTALCQVLPSGSGFDNENNLRLFVALIHASRHTLVICSPYFVPDEAIMLAVVSAALRGVDVTLYNSEAQDQFLVAYAQRSYYDELLRAGVKIRLYKAPALLHSKTMSIDDDIALVGSSNLDMRSFRLNLEVTLICYDGGVVADLREAEALYQARSRLLDLATWQQRRLPQRTAENLARLFSALL